MKIIVVALLTFISSTAIAQFNRGITNKDLKVLVGNWQGTAVITDTAYNNAMYSLSSVIEITDKTDSLVVNFTNTGTKGKAITEKTSLYIYDEGKMISIGGDAYEITYTSRRGIRLTLVAEKQAYENYKLMDFRQQYIFGPTVLNIIKEARFIDMDAYFIRSRASYTKK